MQRVVSLIGYRAFKPTYKQAGLITVAILQEDDIKVRTA